MRRDQIDWRETVRIDCAAAMLPRPSSDWPIHPPEPLTFALAWPTYRVALEVLPPDMHVSPEMVWKLNQAAVLGWRVLLYSVSQILALKARDDMSKIVEAESHLHPTIGRQAHMDQSATVGPQVLVDADPHAGYGPEE